MAEVEVRECGTAAELIDQLNPSRDDWWDESNEQTHCFRGHRDADWPLLAKAFRPLSISGLGPFYQKVKEKAADPGFVEWREGAISLAFQNFQRAAREIGVDVQPQDKHLAQHHGIPTDLLDWSFSPHIAAYFSLDESSASTATHLCVWAMRRASAVIDNFIVSVRDYPVERNPYMRAQRGSFSVVNFISSYNSDNEDEPVPSLQSLHAMAAKPFLTQFTLPWAEAGELRRLLRRHGVSAAALQPSLDRVAADVLAVGPR
ncbi:FRG domain-containing protein [Sinorhizobium meliloti]|nr:FRG domain-containing protein [Sinorhizobium meliloti]